VAAVVGVGAAAALSLSVAVLPAPTFEAVPLTSMPGLAPAGDRLSCSRKKVGKEALPRLPGPSGYPRCGRPPGPVAKLAGQKAAVVGQRDRTSPGEPSSLGGSEGDEKRRVLQRGKNV
jgi:hypothetical protein